MSEPPAAVDVLCNDCGFKAMADLGEFRLDRAWNPEFVPGPGDRALLLAPALRDVNPLKLRKARKMTCEGCGITIYVAASSQWLLDLKASIEGRHP